MEHQCPRCGDDAVAIGLEHDGSDYLMVSCARCDTREWLVDGVNDDLGRVLQRLAGRVAKQPTTI